MSWTYYVISTPTQSQIGKFKSSKIQITVSLLNKNKGARALDETPRITNFYFFNNLLLFAISVHSATNIRYEVMYLHIIDLPKFRSP